MTGQRLFFLLLTALLIFGCGDDGDDSTDGTGGEASAGGAMTGGEMTGGAMPGGAIPGGAMTGGAMPGGEMAGGTMTGGEMAGGAMPGGAMPGGAMPGGTMAGGAMAGGEMAAGGEMPPFMADCSMPNMMCYTPRASPGNNPRLMVQVVNVPASTIELVNRTNEDIDMTGWVIVRGDDVTALPVNAEDTVIGSIDTYDLNFGANATQGGDPLALTGELAIYADANTNDAANLRVYLAWGAPSASPAAAHAAAVGLWPAGQYAGICGENVGLVGVGDVSGPNGYRSVPANCF